MKRFCILAVLLTAVPAMAEKVPFSDYQSIVDRQMFGPLPDDFDPTKMPSEVAKSASQQKELTKEQEQLQSSIHFSMINVTSDGVTEVGFSDKSDPKAPRHYCLKVGESRDGWTVVEADPVSGSMTIARRDIEVTLTIGNDSSKGGGTTTRPNASAATDASMPRRSGLLGMSGSLRSRRLLRAEEQKRQDELDRQRREEEQQRREEERLQREEERESTRQQLNALVAEVKGLREVKQQQRQKETESAETAPKTTENENSQPE